MRRITRRSALWFLLLAAWCGGFLLTACSSGPRIFTDYDKDADFSSYDTFAFIDPLGTDRSGYTTLITDYFKAAITKEMRHKGFAYSDNNPDLLINVFANTQNRTDIETSATPLYGSSDYYAYRGGLYGSFPIYERDVNTIHYKVGTLNIDLVDANKKQLIWEGIAEGRLTKKAMDNPKVAIESAVEAIFKQFPAATRKQPEPES